MPSFNHLSQLALKKKSFKCFNVFLWFELRTPWHRAFFDPGTFICTQIVEVYYAMQQTKFQATEPGVSEIEYFLIFFSTYLYESNQ